MLLTLIYEKIHVLLVLLFICTYFLIHTLRDKGIIFFTANKEFFFLQILGRFLYFVSFIQKKFFRNNKSITNYDELCFLIGVMKKYTRTFCKRKD